MKNQTFLKLSRRQGKKLGKKENVKLKKRGPKDYRSNNKRDSVSKLCFKIKFNQGYRHGKITADEAGGDVIAEDEKRDN